jgi:hypothetical protein
MQVCGKGRDTANGRLAIAAITELGIVSKIRPAQAAVPVTEPYEPFW